MHPNVLNSLNSHMFSETENGNVNMMDNRLYNVRLRMFADIIVAYDLCIVNTLKNLLNFCILDFFF